MTALRDLDKLSWDAALEAARVLTTLSMNRAEDRKRYREAKAKLAAILPEGADVGSIITQAVRWDMDSAIAEVCAGMDERVWVAPSASR